MADDDDKSGSEERDEITPHTEEKELPKEQKQTAKSTKVMKSIAYLYINLTWIASYAMDTI